ncbi:MAG: ABC transporter ATP-binding protein, partial [Clostridium sp.]
ETLIIENLYKKYKSKKALENINISINKGEIVGLVGPNGAGKTTLMKIICDLIEWDEGIVKVCNTTPLENRVKYLSNISSIIETPALYEDLKGIDNINFISKLNNVSREKIQDIIKFINIGEDINKKVKSYSLGMKQRLALGIALITEPKLLILDEPTNGLDPQGVLEFRELLKKYSRENNVSILISSHNLSELDKLCTKIIFIRDGKLIENSQINNEKSIQTIFLTVKNINEEIEKIKKIALLKEVIVNGNEIEIKVNKEETSKVMELLIINQIKYENIQITNNTIEESYKKVYLGGDNE